MKFGLSLVGLSLRHHAEIAAQAEAHGFESVWIGEHLLWPAEIPATYPYDPSGRPGVDPSTPLYDPWVSMAYVARATSHIRLGTNVYILPLRHPVITARAVTTLDRVSGGRVTLGAGVGWLEPEFDALGIPFSERGARMDEGIDVLRKLWTDEVPTHDGRFYPFGPIRFEPKPFQKPCPPIETGGASPRALRRAALKGDGWIEIDSGSTDILAERIATIHDARREAGRDHLPFEVSVSGAAALDRANALRAEACGATRIVASPFAVMKQPRKADFEAFVTRYAEDVVSAFKPDAANDATPRGRD